jgi:hypothetical protein
VTQVTGLSLKGSAVCRPEIVRLLNSFSVQLLWSSRSKGAEALSHTCGSLTVGCWVARLTSRQQQLLCS